MKKVALKQAAFKVLSHKEILKRRSSRLLSKNALTVLNFHRVSPNIKSTYSGITPELFEEVIQYLKINFNLCLFHESNQIKNNKPNLIISFDDGYKDFIEYAAPILDKYKVKVNQNIIPYCIKTSNPPVNVMLQDFIGSAPLGLLKKIPLDFGIKEITKISRSKLGYLGSLKIKYLPESEFVCKRNELLNFLLLYPDFLDSRVMTKENILEISTVHEIGVHSYEHLSMASQSVEYFKNDLIKCKQYFSDELKIPNDIYAFPNGSATSEQIEITKEYGFNKILMVNEKYSYSPFEVINRFTFDAKTLPEAKYKIHGRMARI